MRTALSGLTALALLATTAPAAAQEAAPTEQAPPPRKATNLDELLQQVQKLRTRNREENQRREREFLSEKQSQARLLQQAKNTLQREEARSERLEASFNKNEQDLAQLEQQLTERLGAFRELFGTVRAVAGDTRAMVDQSLVSLEYPGRSEFLTSLTSRKELELPSIQELQLLWEILLQEAIESSKVVRFPAKVVTIDGRQEERDVIRLGVFNAVAEGQYLQFLWEAANPLAELSRQPPGGDLGELWSANGRDGTLVGVAVDPSRGAILRQLLQTKNFFQRIPDGRWIGVIIIIMAVVGVLLAAFQWIYLWLVGRQIGTQLDSDQPSQDNPLGRVLNAYHQNRAADVETIELKLDEAVLRETPRLERFLTTIRVLSVVAPLLGLLGTVTGMITTFQSIVLFGTGDPKTMAGGISEALVTTMLGLIAAIPLTLLHSFASGRSKAVIHVLDEQSAGIIARHAESHGSGAAGGGHGGD